MTNYKEIAAKYERSWHLPLSPQETMYLKTVALMGLSLYQWGASVVALYGMLTGQWLMAIFGMVTIITLDVVKVRVDQRLRSYLDHLLHDLLAGAIEQENHKREQRPWN